MGKALLPYLELKVHSLIQQNDWRSIRVIGEYHRGCCVSELEKNDKMFNWHRPTAEIAGTELIVKCFPGRDYVYHYALIIATYLAMKGRFREQVRYDAPDASICNAAVAHLGVDASEYRAVILGWGVEHLAGTEGWTFVDGYAWKRATSVGFSVLYLGFLHSIWGDVAGRVVTRLGALGAQRIVYIGKVGTLDPSLKPNTVLGTGDESLVGLRRVRWTDFFDLHARDESDVVSGIHVTSPSTLLETRKWLKAQQGYTFVDPEIGPMGEAAHEQRIPFGYMHVVSNNLARPYLEDLSNERAVNVVVQRRRLLDRAKEIIQMQLNRIDSGDCLG
jgi:hypothetical protein